jgi:hypothetical protein
MTKKELLKQMRAAQKLQDKINNEECKIPNPNYKKGKASFSDMFNSVNRAKYIQVDY